MVSGPLAQMRAHSFLPFICGLRPAFICSDFLAWVGECVRVGFAFICSLRSTSFGRARVSLKFVKRECIRSFIGSVGLTSFVVC